MNTQLSTIRMQHVARTLALTGLLVGLLARPQPARAAGLCYVWGSSAGPTHDGSTWTFAYLNPQDALANVACTEIWVAAGTYTPGALRADTFSLKTGVALYGGFAGTETLLGQRDPAANVTTLSGEIGTPADASDNSYHVVSANGLDSTAVLDGFTITAGNAIGVLYAIGGGISNIFSSAVYSNLIVSGNVGTSGGGMAVLYAATPELTNVTFTGNNADYGAGIYSYVAGAGSPSLTNVTFDGNTAGGGGAMLNWSSSPVLRNVTLGANTASAGQGMYNIYSSSPTIRNSVLWDGGDEIADDATGAATIVDSVVQGGCPASATCTNVLSTDPLLGALTDNGGFTPTRSIGAGGSARDAGGINSTCAATDQRGVTRPQGPHCDIGAFELSQTTVLYRSVGAQDGWLLEKSETSGKAGSSDAAATQFYVGDDAAKKQYRGILAFDTSGLPDTATITGVTLKIKKTGLVGANPFSSLGNIVVDIKKGFWSGNAALQLTDFYAAGTKNFVTQFTNAPVSNWYSTAFGPSTFGYLNLTGTTQFRLRFATDDNNNLVADYLKFGSGNATTTSRPQLVITYVP